MINWQDSLDSWFGFTGLPEEERKRRRLSVELILFTVTGGLINYAVACSLGMGYLQVATIVYCILALLNILALRLFHQFRVYRYFGLGLLFLFSFLGHIGSGGYYNSGAVAVSGLLAVIGALLFATIPWARVVLGLFVLGLWLMSWYDWVYPQVPISRGFVLANFASNLSFVSVMAYISLETFLLKIQKLRGELGQAKDKIEGLLLNILPEETAAELMQTGHAKARNYLSATIIFTDFVGFSRIAAELSPEQVVEEIDFYFQAFDEITDRHGLEKIKTIGDAYMAVGGVPVKNKTHAADAVRAGLEICEFVKNAEPISKQRCGFPFSVRVGIHTGPLVAGVVGVKKFAFDVWGDSVNLSARMEENSEPNRVNISQNTFERVKNDFTCTHRGKISAKNRGEIDMYFVGEG